MSAKRKWVSFNLGTGVRNKVRPVALRLKRRKRDVVRLLLDYRLNLDDDVAFHVWYELSKGSDWHCNMRLSEENIARVDAERARRAQTRVDGEAFSEEVREYEGWSRLVERDRAGSERWSRTRTLRACIASALDMLKDAKRATSFYGEHAVVDRPSTVRMVCRSISMMPSMLQTIDRTAHDAEETRSVAVVRLVADQLDAKDVRAIDIEGLAQQVSVWAPSDFWGTLDMRAIETDASVSGLLRAMLCDGLALEDGG